MSTAVVELMVVSPNTEREVRASVVPPGQIPLSPSPKVIAAIHDAAGTLNDYPPFGDESLRDALAETLGRGLTQFEKLAAKG